MTAGPITSPSLSMSKLSADPNLKPLRILHLLGCKEDIGGVLTVVRELAATSVAQGAIHAGLVHTSFVERRPSSLQWCRSPHLRMESPRVASLLWCGFRAALELGQHQKKFNPTVLHAHSRGPLATVLFARLLVKTPPILFTNHAFARTPAFYRWAAARPGLTTVVLSHSMATHYGLTPLPSNVKIIPACCSDALFERPLQPSIRFPQRIRLVGVGNLIRWKKWNLVLDALARLPISLRQRFHFTLWGPTPSDPDSQTFAGELKAMIGQLGLAPYVRLAGPTLDVPSAIEASDLFVLPSTNEPCSVALAEALALGRPAVVSSSGGNVDIVQHGRTGRLFKPDDPADLARQLAGYAEGDWTTAGPEECRESIRHHAASAVWNLYDKLYQRLLVGPPSL